MGEAPDPWVIMGYGLGYWDVRKATFSYYYYVKVVDRFSPEKCHKVHQLSTMDVLCSWR